MLILCVIAGGFRTWPALVLPFDCTGDAAGCQNCIARIRWLQWADDATSIDFIPVNKLCGLFADKFAHFNSNYDFALYCNTRCRESRGHRAAIVTALQLFRASLREEPSWGVVASKIGCDETLTDALMSMPVQPAPAEGHHDVDAAELSESTTDYSDNGDTDGDSDHEAAAEEFPKRSKATKVHSSSLEAGLQQVKRSLPRSATRRMPQPRVPFRSRNVGLLSSATSCGPCGSFCSRTEEHLCGSIL